MPVATAPEEIELVFRPRGGNRALFSCADPEILIEGPAGSGKTRATLELLHRTCTQIPKTRLLMLRKARATLATTAIATFENDVLHPLDNVHYFGGNDQKPAGYYYPNGSVIVIGGMDDPGKILSSFYDIAYANEATELTEEEWELITTRLRNGVLKSPRIIGDCNPTFAKHWLNRRALLGKITRITTSIRDNPAYFDEDGTPTELGARYVRTLESLSGSRRERFLLGNWVGVENAIYPHFDRRLHVRPLESGLRFRSGAIGVDYGRRHKAAAVAISVDQYGRRWVREAWGEPDKEHGEETRRMVGQLMRKYSITSGRTDPTIDGWIGRLPLVPAKGNAGSRNARTIPVGRLLGIFPGGVVPESYEEATWTGKERVQPISLATGRPDSPGLLFVEGAPGIEELCSEIESYHEVLQENDLKSEYVVARIDEDLIAAMEYAIEHLEEPRVNHEEMGTALRALQNRRPKKRR